MWEIKLLIWNRTRARRFREQWPRPGGASFERHFKFANSDGKIVFADTLLKNFALMNGSVTTLVIGYVMHGNTQSQHWRTL
jgi:hypothetical protein